MIIGEGRLEKLDMDKTSHEAGNGNNTNADIGDNSGTQIKIKGTHWISKVGNGNLTYLLSQGQCQSNACK